MAHYKVFRHGKLATEFEAKSDRAAKIRTSKFCNDSADIYKDMGGIELYCDNVCIGLYSPFFFEWSKYTDISYASI